MRVEKSRLPIGQLGRQPNVSGVSILSLNRQWHQDSEDLISTCISVSMIGTWGGQPSVGGKE